MVDLTSTSRIKPQWPSRQGAADQIWLAFVLVQVVLAAYALRRNEHVRIDVINNRLSPKVQAWIDIAGGLFIMPPIMPCGRLNIWYLPISPISMNSLLSQPNCSP